MPGVVVSDGFFEYLPGDFISAPEFTSVISFDYVGSAAVS